MYNKWYQNQWLLVELKNENWICRVSTTKQDLARQERLLKQRGCKLIIKEKVSGISEDRTELEMLKKLVRPKDIIMIESWSRLGRSTKELIELVD